MALRKLAGHTALYGIPSILSRVLNYLLVPLHVMQFDPQEYGVITELYAYTAFCIAFLTYGMETAFFRFSQNHDKLTVYRNALGSIVITSVLFVVACWIWADPLSAWLGYEAHQEYITWFALILALDAISSIAVARLRNESKPLRFAAVNILSMAVQILLNLFFLAYCMPIVKAGGSNWLTSTFYDPSIGVGYVFIANLAASAAKCILLLPQYKGLNFSFDKSLLKEMLRYGFPLLFVTLAGIFNETFSRGFYKYFLAGRIGYDAAMFQLGVFGAVYKLSIIITVFIQAYRYAAEPFFFEHSKESQSREIYSRMLTYFVFVVFGIFLAVTLFLQQFKEVFIPNEKYWEGVYIVPILLLANAFLGISYNLSAWYKLSGKTGYGAYIALVGAAITLVLNWMLIPTMGYEGSAWATFTCYAVIMLLSYYYGQKYFPIPYQLGKVFGIAGLALALFFIDRKLDLSVGPAGFAVKTLFLFIFGVVFMLWEKPALIFNRK